MEDPPQYKRALVYEKWERCKAVYKQSRQPTIHDHTHKWGPEYHRLWQVQSDLRMNNCHMILSQAGLWNSFTP